MKRKILNILVVLAIICTILPVSSVGVVALSSGDFLYKILMDNTVEITEYNGTATELVIPNELDGYKVSSIGYRAFNGNETLTSVIIKGNSSPD